MIIYERQPKLKWKSHYMPLNNAPSHTHWKPWNLWLNLIHPSNPSNNIKRILETIQRNHMKIHFLLEVTWKKYILGFLLHLLTYLKYATCRSFLRSIYPNLILKKPSRKESRLETACFLLKLVVPFNTDHGLPHVDLIDQHMIDLVNQLGPCLSKIDASQR